MDYLKQHLKLHLGAAIAATALAIGASVPAQAEGNVTVQLGPNNQVGEFVAAVQSVANEYQTAPFTITSSQIDPNGKPFTPERYVAAMPGILVINDKYVADAALIENDFEYDVSMNYHSPGCSAQTYLGIHEAAHQIDYTHGMRARELAARWASTQPDSTAEQLSGYSFNNAGYFSPAEALAEAFASVRCDPKDSTPAEWMLFNILTTTQ